MQIAEFNNNIILTELSDFSLPEILECGQCFTFNQVEIDSKAKEKAEAESNKICFAYDGTAFGHAAAIRQNRDGSLVFKNMKRAEFDEIWLSYFDLNTNYSAIKAELSKDATLKKAIDYAPGIRVLRQDGWEALCCFILSQNNNIKRIQGIVGRFCKEFGEPLGGEIFSFPTAAKLKGATINDLAPLRSGFRAKYLVDAIEKVNSGEVDLESLKSLSLEEASAKLQLIKGVGPKVSDCTLLYGFHRLECCPMDVWMKRVMAKLYPNGFPDCAAKYIGIAQQYLFHYSRLSSVLELV